MSTTQTQTHIVYRNRLEHDFYESGMLIPLIGALLAGFVVFLALAALFERASRRWSIGKLDNMLLGGFGLIAAGCGAAVFRWLSF